MPRPTFYFGSMTVDADLNTLAQGYLLPIDRTTSWTSVAGDWNFGSLNNQTMTLPLAPLADQRIRFTSSSAAVVQITLNPNGQLINGVAGNTVISDVILDFELVFRGGSLGWVLSNPGLSGLSTRNIIIGGNFDTNPWQRGTSFLNWVSSTHSADRWKLGSVTAGTVDATRETYAPTIAQAGIFSTYCLRIAVATADVSVAITDFVCVRNLVEGYDWAQLAQRPCVLSFWHAHTKVGINCAGLRSSNGDRSCVFEYSQAVTAAWEYSEIRFPASPSAGTWNYTNGVGVLIDFTMMAGTNFHTATPGVWVVVSVFATANQVNNMDAVNNMFRIALVQLEPGSVATPYQVRPAEEELALAQRYYEKSYSQGVVVPTNASVGSYFAQAGAAVATGSVWGYVKFAVTKRAAPTVTMYSYTSSTSGAGSVASGGDLAASSALSTQVGDSGFSIINSSGGNITPGAGGFICHWAASAEL